MGENKTGFYELVNGLSKTQKQSFTGLTQYLADFQV